MRIFEIVGRNIPQRRTQKIDEDKINWDVVEIAIANFKNGFVFDRYMPMQEEMDVNVLYGDSNIVERKSRNTTNEYTLLMQRLPEWKQYPPRQKSFICSLRQFTPDRPPYLEWVVLPFGNPKVGVCSEADLWASFDKTGYRPDMLNNFIQNAAKICEIQLSQDNPELLIQQLRQIQQMLPEKLEGEENYNNRLLVNPNTKKIFEQGDVIQNLSLFLSPSKNGFQLCNLNNLPDVGHTREVWFSGQAYFIDALRLRHLLKQRQT